MTDLEILVTRTVENALASMFQKQASDVAHEIAEEIFRDNRARFTQLIERAIDQALENMSKQQE